MAPILLWFKNSASATGSVGGTWMYENDARTSGPVCHSAKSIGNTPRRQLQLPGTSESTFLLYPVSRVLARDHTHRRDQIMVANSCQHIPECRSKFLVPELEIVRLLNGDNKVLTGETGAGLRKALLGQGNRVLCKSPV